MREKGNTCNICIVRYNSVMKTNPTSTTYKTLDNAYNFFNIHLFEGKLPTCLITMQRKGKARGYFCPERFEARKEDKYHTHEIALNPQYFSDRSDEEIISTLVHEMVHLWQQENGNPSRAGYHNKQWVEKMEDIGLIPSSTGEEGGAQTGHSVSHYIDEKGKYASLIPIFFEENEPLTFQDRPVMSAAKAKAKNKVKYTCPECKLNAWGKPNVSLMCGNDKNYLVEL